MSDVNVIRGENGALIMARTCLCAVRFWSSFLSARNLRPKPYAHVQPVEVTSALSTSALTLIFLIGYGAERQIFRLRVHP
ncbi:uncharacterized protein PHALS_14920 [Plasmopara halstedii]|uniref:Uncharacterized protein n=1 Tax=Plasmopara halstedii TaxID=4781 RepID=A0A0N7L3R9_PLAHL|nr:uncharacterized protein PHALS_14920 [Plasmopara halstedii]CEG36643.1 hypothetical protein PHALS_14920 [Plasmopara halstedii]|eukprot:XP_024573012.1 hypothetical protein PHALS_14920 [Plasmopara halstedii]